MAVRFDPPGLHAQPRPTPAARRLVQQVVAEHRQELGAFTQHEVEALKPLLARAKAELGKQLIHWIETAPDGELRWTAQSYRAALAQVNEMARFLGVGLDKQLEAGVGDVEHMAIRHVARDLARFSEVFDHSVRNVHLDAAKLVATGRSFIIPRVRSSAKRYSKNIQRDIRDRLAIDILKGAPVHETVQRLVEHGGPRGVVSVQGVIGEKGAIAEYIPEGLFKRYDYWAERIVRTEYASAYGGATLDSLDEGARQVPDLKKVWMTAPGCCLHICAPLDGVAVGLNEKWESDVGPLDSSPAHPNCRCTISGWCDRWGDPPRLPENQKGEDADRRVRT